jgi:hypothetical protein
LPRRTEASSGGRERESRKDVGRTGEGTTVGAPERQETGVITVVESGDATSTA